MYFVKLVILVDLVSTLLISNAINNSKNILIIIPGLLGLPPVWRSTAASLTRWTTGASSFHRPPPRSVARWSTTVSRVTRGMDPSRGLVERTGKTLICPLCYEVRLGSVRLCWVRLVRPPLRYEAKWSTIASRVT